MTIESEALSSDALKPVSIDCTPGALLRDCESEPRLAEVVLSKQHDIADFSRPLRLGEYAPKLPWLDQFRVAREALLRTVSWCG